ncbi:hypothetical protein [Rheinheimera sp.]|uniref:hypothetical protein n=1 Tax=Rheinheimera sp. TaxID=1869214 RepID=UPI002734686D|nr:hypothetical protein [Rheinheimera sp.]MDP2713972.1 hypothetical protein [Rheinheimera sp.]
MEKSQITPEKITKPIQLLGAWLVGLLTVDSAFLFAAVKMDTASWHSGALTIAAILNVPLFIGALFLLQTRFRPELQEDSYYSTYLSNRTNEPIKVTRDEALINMLEKRLESIERDIKKGAAPIEEHTPNLSKLSFAINVQLPNKSEIVSELSALGVLGYEEFGEESSPPELLKVAIAESISKVELNEILKLAKKLGFTHYGFIEHFEEIYEDVLFGAYGEERRRIA